MEVKQIYDLVNKVTKEVLGEEALSVSEDLSNVVDLGTELFNANAVDKYVKTLVNHIGKVVFVNRAYQGGVPKVLMDGWEFGSVLEKIQADIPEATENESWELEDKKSYDPNIFYKPKVSAKFFNSKVTFEVPCSFTDMQVKQSFDNATQLNAFISMIYNAVEKSMTLKLDGLIMRTINNFIGETIANEYTDSDYTTKSGVRAINLLYKYNNTENKGKTALTADVAMYSKDFLRYASREINLYMSRLSRMSTLFNIGGKERFTPRDLLHVVMLDEFTTAVSTYLESDTFHNELVKLPNYEHVPFWQGSGTDYAFDTTSKIDVKTSGGHSIATSGILCCMFDRDALGVCNQDRRVTSNYNPKAEFTSNWFKWDASYFNDQNENFIVFFIA